MPVDRDCRVVVGRFPGSARLAVIGAADEFVLVIVEKCSPTCVSPAFSFPFLASLFVVECANDTLLLKRRPLSGTFTDVPKSSSLAGLGKSLHVAMLQKYTACPYGGLNASRRKFIHARYVNALILLNASVDCCRVVKLIVYQLFVTSLRIHILLLGHNWTTDIAGVVRVNKIAKFTFRMSS